MSVTFAADPGDYHAAQGGDDDDARPYPRIFEDREHGRSTGDAAQSRGIKAVFVGAPADQQACHKQHSNDDEHREAASGGYLPAEPRQCDQECEEDHGNVEQRRGIRRSVRDGQRNSGGHHPASRVGPDPGMDHQPGRERQRNTDKAS